MIGPTELANKGFRRRWFLARELVFWRRLNELKIRSFTAELLAEMDIDAGMTRLEDAPIMIADDVESLARQLFEEYGTNADLEAWKQADREHGLGNIASSQHWLLVTDRVRLIKNRMGGLCNA